MSSILSENYKLAPIKKVGKKQFAVGKVANCILPTANFMFAK